MTKWIVAFVAAAALAACSDQGGGKGTGDMLAVDGKTIALEQCGSCHATGATGTSSNPKAPVFRTILSRYSEAALVDDLAEGIRIGHPDMPKIQLRPEGIDALIAYLKSIQEKPDL